MSTYDKQDRGSDADYAAYFAGMNQSMQQKVALTTAHFPPSGTVADMGSGSGQATYDLACLYSGLVLVGVDINPKAVEIAAATFRRSNLRYIQGDIAEAVFPEESLDGILDSSVLHHVTSFNGYSLEPIERLLDNQTAALKAGGVLIIRDFVIPPGPEQVELELGDDEAALFVRFAETWNSSLGPVRYEERPPSREGVRRFRLAHRVAAEFVLRKDYRDHWDTELLEEYTYYAQADFERAFVTRGLRVVTSVELHNPWIVAHRFRGKVAFFDLAGEAIGTPPTNYLIVGEKVAADRGVRLEETSSEILSAPSFLRLSAYRHTDTGHIYELAERPKRTIDVVPHFSFEGRPFIVCKHGFPRPIVNARCDAPDLIGQTGAGYITEPLSAIVADREPPQQAVSRILRERAGIELEPTLAPPWRYFTSPGGINERVDAHLVEIPPWRHARRIDNYSSFTDSGDVRFLDATQVLRACHVGGMFDSRLELNVYRLCRERGYRLGPWIGAELSLADRAAPARKPWPTPRACFEAVPLERAAFLALARGSFVERDARGRVLAEARFEYVRPRTLSHNTLSVLPVLRSGTTLWVGLEWRDLPAVQTFEGTSSFFTVPAMRLPRSARDLSQAQQVAEQSLGREHDLSFHALTPIGGRYYPSPGLTPEVVYPFAGEVTRVGPRCGLYFVPLEEALAQPIVDAHLLTSLFRVAHAFAR